MEIYHRAVAQVIRCSEAATNLLITFNCLSLWAGRGVTSAYTEPRRDWGRAVRGMVSAERTTQTNWIQPWRKCKWKAACEFRECLGLGIMRRLSNLKNKVKDMTLLVFVMSNIRKFMDEKGFYNWIGFYCQLNYYHSLMGKIAGKSNLNQFNKAEFVFFNPVVCLLCLLASKVCHHSVLSGNGKCLEDFTLVM